MQQLVDHIIWNYPSPSYYTFNPEVRELMEHYRTRNTWETRGIKPVPKPRPPAKPLRRRKDIRTATRSQAIRHQKLRYQIQEEAFYAKEHRLPILFATLTLDEQNINKFFTDTKCWTKFADQIKKQFRRWDPEFKVRWSFVLDVGEQNGRLHLHGLITISQKIAHALGDPARRKLSHREIEYFKAIWPYGWACVRYARFGKNDYLARDLKFRWPLQKNQKTQQYEEVREHEDPNQLAEYLIIYVNKEYRLPSGRLKWRNKTTRGYGQQRIKALATALRPDIEDTLKVLQAPNRHIQASAETQYQRQWPLPPRAWTRANLIKSLLTPAPSGNAINSPNPTEDTTYTMPHWMIPYGQLGPVKEALQTFSKTGKMRLINQLPGLSGVIARIETRFANKDYSRLYNHDLFNNRTGTAKRSSEGFAVLWREIDALKPQRHNRTRDQRAKAVQRTAFYNRQYSETLDKYSRVTI